MSQVELFKAHCRDLEKVKRDFEENHIFSSAKNLKYDFEGAYYAIMKARARISQERPSGQLGSTSALCSVKLQR
ncbi:hypothetical protein PR048_018805 [Dryococelus australis]|uniref:Uncharacterized protein n=1 Tax=Dryococelus australis TaxID=614101 RepID=A0ABQ9H221_9NEOP|nr:hypothetical protein PR048_018805 [Dryococelus australis]